MKKVIVSFVIKKSGEAHDIEVPLEISANELIIGLSSAYSLDMDVTNISKCFLQSENPIALLKGNKTLEEFGIIDGSTIYYTE